MPRRLWDSVRVISKLPSIIKQQQQQQQQHFLSFPIVDGSNRRNNTSMIATTSVQMRMTPPVAMATTTQMTLRSTHQSPRDRKRKKRSSPIVRHTFFPTLSLLFAVAWMMQPAMAAAAHTPVVSTAPMETATTLPPVLLLPPLRLGWTNLVSAAGLVILSSISLTQLFGGGWNLPFLARDLLAACARCSLQLNLIGGMVLTHFLVLSQSRPWMVGLWMCTTGILAAREAAARVEYTYPKMKRHMVVALLVGGGSIMGASALLQVLGPLQPWFAPRTWIPISGMLYGNALTATGLAVAAWTQEVALRRSPIEWRLSRGASWKEALQTVVRFSFTTALTPVINALSVTGLVHLPGMMTGQILAGQSPYQAAAYQVLIFLLIAASCVVSVQTVIRCAVGATVDQNNHRLAPIDIFAPVNNNDNNDNNKLRAAADVSSPSSPFPVQSPSSSPDVDCRRVEVVLSDNRPVRETYHVNNGTTPVLRLDQMKVERIQAQISLDLHTGDRIGIQGRSGIGKSQVLRTIAGLEKLDRNCVYIHGTSAAHMAMPTWRRRVALVPQDRPAAGLEGTPRQFFQEACKYQSSSTRWDTTQTSKGAAGVVVVAEVSHDDPARIAASWDLPVSAFDQPWSTLSGGEAQGASLAIALALKPDVLLLDECTNAMDEPTAIKVEETLKQLGVPVLLVSHSAAQQKRFCSSGVMDMSQCNIGAVTLMQ